MSDPERSAETPGGEATVIRLQGRVSRQEAGDVWRKAREAIDSGPAKFFLDFEGVSGIDTAGVALVRLARERCQERGIDFGLRNVPGDISQFLEYTRQHSSGCQEPEKPPQPGWISRAGERFLEKIGALAHFIRFIGDFTLAGLRVLRQPSRLRPGEILHHLQLVGAEAIPLVGALSALMGMIMVFQGALTMQNTGAKIYIADMVGIAVTREMAPLLTAVLIAGRSGAAFAAEIGSMKLNQEIDALEVMGFDIAGFIVLPRVLAITLAGPLLTLFADGAGIVGGMITSHAIVGLSVESFFSEIHQTLVPPDIYTGIIKGFTFAFLIGLTGCFCGLRTQMAASSVGVQTTTAVVVSILLIVMADGLLAGVFQLYGW
jgi:phospholipid/cholesterol/gamma-HCH transport system permease protein